MKILGKFDSSFYKWTVRILKSRDLVKIDMKTKTDTLDDLIWWLGIEDIKHLIPILQKAIKEGGV